MSGTRLPALQRDEFPKPEQKTAFDAVDEEAAATFGSPENSAFTFKDNRGTFVGPFPFFLESPDAGLHLASIFRKLAAIPGFPPDARETAIMTVGAHFQADYELYSHKNVAMKKVGMSAETVEAIASGEKPQGLNEMCSLAYDVATYLVTIPGKLSDALWERCIENFGKEGTVALIHYVYVSSTATLPSLQTRPLTAE